MTWDFNTWMLPFPFVFTLIALTVTVAIDPYISRLHRRVMGIIIFLSCILILQNLADVTLGVGPLRWFWRITSSVVGYSLRPVFPILFLYVIRPERKYLGCRALTILNWAVQMTAYFSPVCFWFDENNLSARRGSNALFEDPA